MQFAARYGALSILFCVQHPRDCDRTRRENISGDPLVGRLRQLNLIQQWVNNAIAPPPADPALFDIWSILPREGNCNDYAVSKRHILLEAGWPAASLLLAEVRLIATGEHHLILIEKDASGEWVLDNLRPFVVRLPVIRNDYTWERVQSIRDLGDGRNRSEDWGEPAKRFSPSSSSPYYYGP